MSGDKHFKFEPSIKYVAVELLNKEKIRPANISVRKEDIEIGLFAGIKTEVTGSLATIFICLQQGNTMKAFNVDKYNVLSVEAAHGMYKEELFFQANLPDQMVAMECLNEILAALSDKFMTSTDKKSVKIDKYTEVPDILAKDTKASVVGAKSSSIYSSTSTGGGNRSGGQTYNSGSYTKSTYLTPSEKKKLTKPTFFKRSTTTPTEEMLAAMKENILKIQKGEYEQPEFKALEADTLDTTADDDDDDPYDGYGPNGDWMGVGGY